MLYTMHLPAAEAHKLVPLRDPRPRLQPVSEPAARPLPDAIRATTRRRLTRPAAV